MSCDKQLQESKKDMDYGAILWHLRHRSIQRIYCLQVSQSYLECSEKSIRRLFNRQLGEEFMADMLRSRAESDSGQRPTVKRALLSCGVTVPCKPPGRDVRTAVGQPVVPTRWRCHICPSTTTRKSKTVCSQCHFLRSHCTSNIVCDSYKNDSDEADE